MSFFAELKRRNVFRVGIAYVVGGWLLLQLTDVLSELLDLPDVVGRAIVLVVAIGLPVALFFAWAFEMTPEGVKLEKDIDRSQSITPKTGKKLNNTIMVLLVLTVAYLLFDKFSEKGSEPFSQQSSVQTADAEEKRALTPTNATTKTGDSDKSIAVLPFVNRSPNADDAYFTDGVHDDLLTQLAKIDAFSVISRTSVLEYRDTAKNLKQIGEELGVANIMEGAVQRSGSRVRINVQLIDTGTDEHLWAEIYDRELTTENHIDIQSEIAQAIASAMQATLTDSEIASVSDVPTENVKAYELYLQAKRFSLGETEIGFDTAVDLYQEALSLDPNFKLAWIGLAHAYINNYWSYGGNPADREKARQAIDSAKAIDPDFPELFMAEGFYHYWGLLDYETALKNLDLAIANMPGNAEAYMWKGWASRRAGLWDQAIDAMSKAVKLNPRTVINLIEFGQTLAYVGRWDEALAITRKAYEVDPDSFWAKSYLASMLILIDGDTGQANTLMIGAQHTNELTFEFSYLETKLMSGQFEEALEVAESWLPEWDVNRSNINLKEQLLADILMIMGKEAEARKKARSAIDRLAEMKKQMPADYRLFEAELQAYAILGDRQKVIELTDQFLSSKPADAVDDLLDGYRLTQSFALAGMTEECVANLDRFLSGISGTSINWVELDPYFNRIREEPEFIAMMERHR
jgi:TolB-like protein/Tfp pilus assembly protein PilF